MISRSWMLLTVGGAVAVLAVGILVWRNYQESQDGKAQKQFGDALEVFHGTAAGGPATKDAKGSPIPGVERELYRQALAKFDQIYKQRGSAKIGRLAHYYAALCQHALNNDTEAIRILQEEDKNPEPETRSLVRNALAELYRSVGKSDDAIKVYQSMLNDNESKFPRDAVLVGLAQIAEATGKNSEAIGYYQRLTREHGQSVYGNDAKARLAALNPPK